MERLKKLKYTHIADIIREKIKSGDLPAGSILPSHNELSRVFKSSMMTVRKALSVLHDEGLIIFKQGIGTFVTEGGINGTNFILHGFQDEMSEHRIKITTKIIDRNCSCVNYKVMKFLNIKNEKKICCLTRLRFFKENPIILQKTYTSLKYKRIIENYSEDKSLYDFFGNATGKIITQGREIILPICLKSGEAQFLGKTSGDPAFLSYRLSAELSGEPLLFDEAFISGDYTVISVTRLGAQYKFHYSIIDNGKKRIENRILDKKFWENWE